MIFCEECRVKKSWPRSAGYPFSGVQDAKCETCGKSGECHDVPALMLTPESERTFEQKQVYKIMQEGFHDRAENLIITYPSGKFNHPLTELMRKIKIERNGEVDWYATYFLRLRAQQGYQERNK